MRSLLMFMLLSTSSVFANEIIGWNVSKEHSVFPETTHANVEATVTASAPPNSNEARTITIKYKASWGSLAEEGSFAFLSRSDNGTEMTLSVVGRSVIAEVPSFVESEISFTTDSGGPYKIFVYDGSLNNRKYIGEF